MPPLKRKQASDHADWLRAFDAIRAAPDHDRATALIEEAADRVRRRLSVFSHPSRATSVAFGWSGGKDSLALEQVAQAAGVEDSVLVISGLEYPAFLAWATDHMPWGLTVECRSGLDHRWLAAHPDMLFPADAQTAGRWFAQVQHAGQRRFAKRVGLDLLLLGRRAADGNFLGQATPYGHEYRDRKGFLRYSPISTWSHEDVLHVLASRAVALPPCYSWPRGFRVGTGPWPARQWTRSRDHAWGEVRSIDLSVVETAARYGIPGAKEALA